LVIAAVIIAAITIGVRTLTRTDTTTTALPLDDAVERYRESTTTATSAERSTAPPLTTGSSAPAMITDGPTLPAPGVYLYDTTGSDGVDALGGADHAYPAATTMTVTPAPCGVTTRWDVAVERWEETTSCLVDGGVQQTTLVAYHQFFGTGDTDNEQCTGAPRPVDAATGIVWTFTCTQAGAISTWEGRVIGRDELDIGGTTVDALHVVTVFDNPASGDDQHIETWYLHGSDLVLREIGRRDTTDPSPIGDVHYHERYEIMLASLTPQR
jgi:hypothetical protein